MHIYICVYTYSTCIYIYPQLFYDEFLGVSESVFQQRYERTTFGRVRSASVAGNGVVNR